MVADSVVGLAEEVLVVVAPEAAGKKQDSRFLAVLFRSQLFC